MTRRIKKRGEGAITAIDRELHEAESEILECIEARGPWPFLTRKVYRDARQEIQVWESRAQRKRLRAEGERVEFLAGDLWRCLWAPGDLNWWIGGIFAFIEVCHAHWAWRPSSLSWWVTWINLLGCVGFMISAVFAVVLPGVDPERAVVLATIANGFTLQGATCFFLGAILLWPEAARKSGT